MSRCIYSNLGKVVPRPTGLAKICVTEFTTIKKYDNYWLQNSKTWVVVKPQV